MIAIPVPVFPRVNPDPSHMMHTLDWFGERSYGNQGFNVENPFREFINLVQNVGAQQSESDIRAMAYLILERSRDVYCPVDKGDLRASAFVDETGHGEHYAAQVTYNTRYAMYVHEDLTKYHAPPTQAKFLDRATEEVIAEFQMTGFGMVGQDVDSHYQVSIIHPVAQGV